MHKVYHKDCLELNAEGLKDCQLIYLDPPYGPKKEDTYYGVGDTLEDYVEWLTERIDHLTSQMTNYNLVVHVDDKCGHYVKVALDKIVGRENFKNEIVWCYSGPSITKSKFVRKHNVLYWWGVGDYVFNQPRIPYKSLSVGGKSSWAGKDVDKEEYLKRGKPHTVEE